MSARAMLATLLLAAVAATPAAAANVTLAVTPAAVSPSPEGTWPLHFAVANHEPYGLYLDSLLVDLTPAAGGATRHVNMRTPSLSTISSEDSLEFDIGLPAAHEDTKVILRLACHTSVTPGILASADVAGAGYDPTKLFPARRVRVAKRDVEWTALLPAANANGAGLLMLRDQGASGDADLLAAMDYRRFGFTVLLVSPPGTAGSSGPADNAGPASLAAAQVALDTLAHTAGVTPERIAVLGRGAGGTLALLLAEKRPDLAAAVAEGANTAPAMAGAEKFKSPVLFVHAERDAHASADAVRALILKLKAQQVTVESKFYPTSADSLTGAEVGRLERRFITVHTAAH
jgi:predicted esterase